MSNNNDSLLELLHQLNLEYDEAVIYLELLRGENTHLRLSKITGINRTKVYRIIDNLEMRSLVARHTDDRGTFLIATDPTTLEIALVTQEEKLKQQRAIFTQVLPQLETLKTNYKSAFIVRTYEGTEGL
jgi:sugar-specific transcriptional regulator TrmB